MLPWYRDPAAHETAPTPTLNTRSKCKGLNVEESLGCPAHLALRVPSATGASGAVHSLAVPSAATSPLPSSPLQLWTLGQGFLFQESSQRSRAEARPGPDGSLT